MKDKFAIKYKKGQLFTMAAVLLITLMFTSFEVFEILHERAAIKERVHSMDNFLKSLEKNLERQVYISGYRIIFLANQEIETKYSSTQTYMADFDAFVDEAFFNGTVNGVPSNITDGAEYRDITNSINKKASKINVIISLNNTVFTMTQEDPWHVKVSMISDFIMSDKNGLASWNKMQHISAFISVENFKDPLFAVGSGGKISRKIKKTTYEGDYSGGNFSSHFNNQYYASHYDAPNFLMRFEGNFSADVNGIESFVDKSYLQQQGESVNQGENSLDYIYFNLNNNPGGKIVQNPPETYFRIDSPHATKYNLTVISGGEPCPTC